VAGSSCASLQNSPPMRICVRAPIFHFLANSAQGPHYSTVPSRRGGTGPSRNGDTEPSRRFGTGLSSRSVGEGFFPIFFVLRDPPRAANRGEEGPVGQKLWVSIIDTRHTSSRAGHSGDSQTRLAIGESLCFRQTLRVDLTHCGWNGTEQTHCSRDAGAS